MPMDAEERQRLRAALTRLTDDADYPLSARQLRSLEGPLVDALDAVFSLFMAVAPNSFGWEDRAKARHVFLRLLEEAE